MKGFSYSNLKLIRQFYNTYPQLSKPISKILAAYFSENTVNNAAETWQISSNEFYKSLQVDVNKTIEISHLGGGQLITNGDDLLNYLSFRHITYLVTIENSLKRYFYEQQTIKCNWNAKQLARQIETLYFERVGLSKNKNEMMEEAPKGTFAEMVKQTVNEPYIFEFTGFKELPKYSEHDLETALLDKIEDFLLELGHGFCFEARQQRITIDGEHDRIDLVFYNRILKCHVLIDLKINKFRKEYVGQMIYYLNYFRDTKMTEGDNPPIGIILCTDKNNTQVQYATAGIEQHIFVSKYLVELPTEQDFINILNNNTL